jgi:lipid-A-disaccharide synthase-like uncharacterized protein
MRLTILTCGLIVCGVHGSILQGAEGEGAAAAAPNVHLKLKIDGVRSVSLQRAANGSHQYVVSDASGTHVLTPDQFADRLYRDHASRSFVHLLFNITSPLGIAWVTVGFLGQAMFTGRMLLQWITSERPRRSVVPVAFWWMSIVGGLMLLAYFLWRKDIVGTIGQSTGVLIYGRNLLLIHRRRRGPRVRGGSKPAVMPSKSRKQPLELQST